MAPHQGLLRRSSDGWPTEDPLSVPVPTEPATPPRSNAVDADFASSSNDVGDSDMVMVLYDALTDPPRGNFTPAEALTHTYAIDQDRDEVVNEVLQGLIDAVATLHIGQLFEVLQRGEGCGTMRIRRPSDVPVDSIRAAMGTKSSSLLEMFCTWHLPLDLTWEMIDIEDDDPGSRTVDVWYWAIQSGSTKISQALRDEGIVPVAMRNAVDHMAHATTRIQEARMDPTVWDAWDRSLDVFANTIDVVNDMISVATANGTSTRGERPLDLTTFLAVLAGDRRKTAEAYNAAAELLEVHKQHRGNSKGTEIIRLNLNEQTSTAFSYMDTALMEAVEIQWGGMVLLLLDHGADPCAAGRGSMTPYERARSLKSEELLGLLVRHDQHGFLALARVDFEGDTTRTP